MPDRNFLLIQMRRFATTLHTSLSNSESAVAAQGAQASVNPALLLARTPAKARLHHQRQVAIVQSTERQDVSGSEAASSINADMTKRLAHPTCEP